MEVRKRVRRVDREWREHGVNLRIEIMVQKLILGLGEVGGLANEDALLRQ